MIHKIGNKWVLKTYDGKKTLGTYDTKEEAEKRERQVQYFKHVGKIIKK